MHVNIAIDVFLISGVVLNMNEHTLVSDHMHAMYVVKRLHIHMFYRVIC